MGSGWRKSGRGGGWVSRGWAGGSDESGQGRDGGGHKRRVFTDAAPLLLGGKTRDSNQTQGLGLGPLKFLFWLPLCLDRAERLGTQLLSLEGWPFCDLLASVLRPICLAHAWPPCLNLRNEILDDVLPNPRPRMGRTQLQDAVPMTLGQARHFEGGCVCGASSVNLVLSGPGDAESRLAPLHSCAT